MKSLLPLALVSISLFAQEVPCACAPMYNASGRVEIKEGWDWYTSGSFIYWQATQENMEIGLIDQATSGFAVHSNVLQMDFDYKPGFKVGFGINCDHDGWDSFFQYTWLHGTHTKSSRQSLTGPSPEVLPMQGHPQEALVLQSGTPTFATTSEIWRLNMDLLDWELARSQYIGTRFSLRPFFAARAAWIYQHLTTNYGTITSENSTLKSSQKSNSWGLGFRAGAGTNWMLGKGFRLYGNGAGDLLYTRYKVVRLRELAKVGTTTSSTLLVKETNVGAIRPHLELEFGFGWGRYFDEKEWHVDLMLGYTFQVFFNQNMFRHYTGVAAPVNAYSQSPNGDLFIQGMTANLRFDF